jgi:hypothetical protein
MLEVDPEKRMSAAEVWSLIDSMKSVPPRVCVQRATDRMQETPRATDCLIEKYTSETDEASSEKVFRQLVIQTTEKETHVAVAMTILQTLETPITTTALKSLALVHRCSFYLQLPD